MAVTAESSRTGEGTDEESRRKIAWKKEGGERGNLKKQHGNKTKKKGARAQAAVKRRANGRQEDSASG